MNFLDDSGAEKRQYIRVPLRVPIKYYSMSAPQSARKVSEAKGNNISVGGMMFIAREKFKPYEELHLEFIMEYSGKKVEMALWGQVVWMEELESDVLYNAGVKFQNLSQNQKDELAEFVNASLKI